MANDAKQKLRKLTASGRAGYSLNRRASDPEDNGADTASQRAPVDDTSSYRLDVKNAGGAPIRATDPKRLRLLDRQKLIHTGPVDHADWNFKPLTGGILHLRYRQILRWLPQRCERLLEIGFGSGVFMPTLASRTAALYGLDVHRRGADVREILSSENITANLICASAEAMPFAAGSFDCIVVASALEFFDDVNAACAEITRVLKPAGNVIAVTPVSSPMVDTGLRVLTGANPKADFGSRRERVIPALQKHFAIREERILRMLLMPLYHAFRLGQRI